MISLTRTLQKDCKSQSLGLKGLSIFVTSFNAITLHGLADILIVFPLTREYISSNPPPRQGFLLLNQGM